MNVGFRPSTQPTGLFLVIRRSLCVQTSHYLVFAARSAIALSGYKAIAPVQASLIHVIVEGAIIYRHL
jgi:hypothetical protein